MYGGQVKVPLVVRSHDRQELGPGRPALAGAAPLLHARARPQGRGAVERLRRQGLPDRRDPRRQPGDVRRAPAALLHRGPCPRTPFDVPSARRASARTATTSRSSASPTCWSSACAPASCSPTSASQAEVIDPIWLRPLDIDTIVAVGRTTGRLLVVDNAWTNCGASAEIVARVARARPERQADPGPTHGLCPDDLPDHAGAGARVLSRSGQDRADRPCHGAARTRRHGSPTRSAPSSPIRPSSAGRSDPAAERYTKRIVTMFYELARQHLGPGGDRGDPARHRVGPLHHGPQRRGIRGGICGLPSAGTMR